MNMDEEIRAPTEASPEPNTLALKLIILGLFAFSAIALWKVASSPPPEKSEPTTQTVAQQELENLTFAEESYQQTIWKCIYLGQQELEQFQGITVKQFQRDIEDGVNEGISPRVTLLRKLNFTRGQLEQAVAEQTHFGGAAQSRGVVRAPILDSLAVLYAMKAEVDGIVIQNVELSPAEYLDCLDELAHYGKRAESMTPAFQRKKLDRLPTQQQAMGGEKDAKWKPY